jgi:hypothetical protein
MPNTAAPKAVEPTTNVRTAVAIFTAIVVLCPIGLVANVLAMLLVIIYKAKDITPAIAEPIKQFMGLGKVVSGGVVISKELRVGSWELRVEIFRLG